MNKSYIPLVDETASIDYRCGSEVLNDLDSHIQKFAIRITTDVDRGYNKEDEQFLHDFTNGAKKFKTLTIHPFKVRKRWIRKRTEDFAISPETCLIISNRFVGLRKLILECGLLTESLENLCQPTLSRLNYLKLGDCRWIKDEAMGAFKNLPKLRELFLNHSEKIHHGLLHLGRVRHLKKLTVTNFSQVDNPIFQQMILKLDHKFESIILEGDNKVFLDSVMEDRLWSKIHNNEIQTLSINGTSIAL